VHVSKKLMLCLLLPLLFEDALRMDLESLRRYATPGGVLILGGTLRCTA
jgi:NhaP-type Na+/H+ or K+/H+ antiporter